MARAIEAKYLVFLQPGINPQALEFFKEFGNHVTGASGGKLLFLPSVEVDFTNPHYLEIAVPSPDDDGGGWPMMIPHHMVLMISGPGTFTESGGVGFTAALRKS
jgi:hypothetical protein